MPTDFTPSADEFVANNARFTIGFRDMDLPVRPERRVAVVACMDSRMDIFSILGLANGEAHVIRNAGGVVTDDVIRSLCVSQRTLGTMEILLIHHTDCGMQKVTEDAFKAELETEFGIKPRWALESFTDPFTDVRQSIKRILMSPFVTSKDHIRGFVYDVATGGLTAVSTG